MLDYKNIIIKQYGLDMSGREIAEQRCVSKSGVNSFFNMFKKCDTLSLLLPNEITNEVIAVQVYGLAQPSHGWDFEFLCVEMRGRGYLASPVLPFLQAICQLAREKRENRVLHRTPETEGGIALLWGRAKTMPG